MNVENIHFLLILSRTVRSESSREFIRMVLTKSAIRMFTAVTLMLVSLIIFKRW